MTGPSARRGLRDAALLVTGFAAALRRSELVALQVDDVEWVEQGFRLHIRRSKTDQEAAGYRIPVPLGVRLKPAATIRARIEAGEITDGHLFRQVNKGDRVLAEPLPGRSVADILKRRVAEAGYDPTLFSGHSAASGATEGTRTYSPRQAALSRASTPRARRAASACCSAREAVRAADA